MIYLAATRPREMTMPRPSTSAHATKIKGLARKNPCQADGEYFYNLRTRTKHVELSGSCPPGATRVLVLSGVMAVVPAAPLIDP